MRWLVGLRFAVFGFLAATLPLGDAFFGFHVKYAVALPVVAVLLVGNAFVHRRLAASSGPLSTRIVAIGAAVDVVAIGAVLGASGGAANPFSAVFFVHVALAATLLPARTTFALAGLSACVFAGLFALPSGSCCAAHAESEGFSAHLYGMWAAFTVAAGLVAFFLTRVRRALEDRNREIAELRLKADEAARFAALGTLAAGTAHELATPLGTIAVLAGEVGSDPAEDPAHGKAIQAQVARCRDILTKMQAGGSAEPSPLARVELAAAVTRAVEAWRAAHPDAVVTVTSGVGAEVRVPLPEGDLEATVCTLLDNALHATKAARSTDAIAVEVTREGAAILVRVEDAGAGVAPHLEGRLGEPFLTTKEPGEGMGLGLYLVRTLLARAGGRLEVARREPKGTRVTLHLSEAAA